MNYEQELLTIHDIEYNDYVYLKDLQLGLLNVSRLEVCIKKYDKLKSIIIKYLDYIEIDKIITNIDSSYHFSDEQQDAINNIIKFLANEDKKLFGLFGYAGTGKTTLIIRIIGYLIVNKHIKTVGISAPTNKALNVLMNKFTNYLKNECNINDENENVDFFTLHKLLNFKPEVTEDGTMDFVRNELLTIRKKYDIIIIDECSMIPQHMVDILLEEIKNYTKVIFCGDDAQLPPINETRSKIFNNIDENITLKKIMRCRNKHVTKLWNVIRLWENNVKPELKRYVNKKNIYFYNNKDEWINKCINNMIDKKYNIILAWTNKCVHDYNEIIRKKVISHDNINDKYAIGDLLIVNGYYEMKGEMTTMKIHTSEQIVVNGVEKIIYKTNNLINRLVNTNYKYLISTIDKINNMTERKYDCWKLKVKKIVSDEEEYDDNFIVYICDDVKLTKEKEESLNILKDFKKYFDKFIKVNKTEKKKIIKSIMKVWYNIFITPFANVNYGYSITVHKSQGSTYNNIFIDVPDILKNNNKDDGKKCLYTATTRASNELHMLLK